jgi:prevent-host-death family protein
MTAKEIGTLEAKTRFSELLSEVEHGQKYFITRHGKPVAELRPFISAKRKPKPGFAKGTFKDVSPDFDEPLEDFAPYME